MGNLTRKQKQTAVRIIVTLVPFAVLFVLELTGVLEPLPVWAQILAFAGPYSIIGYDVIVKAVKNIAHGHIFDENFLMITATVAAFCIGEYSEAVAVMLFYQVGELFQSVAVGKARKSITDLMDIVPEYANVEWNGELKQVDPDDVEVGDIIVIKPGEKIPIDAVITEGESMINTSAITGESVPRRAVPGDHIISGCINGSGTIKARAEKAFEDSTAARILELVENAGSRKAKTENFITRFAKIYTPAVTAAAFILAVIPPLVTGGDWGEWIARACTFLVISCPCALVISVPLGFFGGIGAASKLGILVKGGNYLEAASELTEVVFDKTGTLTKGEFAVSEICPADGVSKEKLLDIAAHAECFSDHPIAVSIRTAYHKPVDISRVDGAEENAGHGLCVRVDGKQVLLGNVGLMSGNGITVREPDCGGTVIYAAEEGNYIGYIVISDGIKEGSPEAIKELKAAGIKRCVMLTGDRKAEADSVSGRLGLDAHYSELLPSDKVGMVEKLLGECGGKLAFVGDGINDAPVLARADVGIAMGSMGSDAAIEAADIVIMDDDLRKIAVMMRLARKTMRIVRENIIFALAVKFIVLVLGALGIANMWLAVFADVGVAVIAILNSMRTLRFTGARNTPPEN